MIGTVKSIELGGNRVVRIGQYLHDPGDGEGPEHRVFIAEGWASSPPLPVHASTVDLPAGKLAELIAALQAMAAE